jgi:addiction module HigA family antidote
MRMHNPPHPGEIIRELCLQPLNLTVTKAAQALGITRKTLSAILNGRSGISPEMALRLSKVFGRTPEGWLRLQSQFDLSEAEASIDISNLKRIEVSAQPQN